MFKFFKKSDKKNLPPRKAIFVSGPIQGRLTTRIGLYWVLYHFVLWHALFAYRYVEFRMANRLPDVTFRELYGEFVLHYYPIVLCAITMLPIFIIDLVRLTHKIAGPIVQFQKRLKQMTAGEAVQRVRLRKGDFMQELESALNEYIDHYEQRRLSESCEFRMSQDDARLIEQVAELKKTVAESQEQADSAPESKEPALLGTAETAPSDQATEESVG